MSDERDPASRDRLGGSSSPPETEGSGEDAKGFSRRSFLKGAGVAVSAGVIVTEGLLETARAAAETKAVGPGAVPITLKINGKELSLQLEPRVTLLDALRDHLDMTGAKKVCDRGTCGSCTVLMDGKAVYSCCVLAIAAQHSEITTIEGLAAEGQLSPVSAAFVEHDAQQCGFCTPGFVMAVTAYLKQHPHPTYEEVTHGLGGNLCRCGTYMGVREAALDAAKRISAGRA
ncbi:MAG TPA: (2Fe-2S)-binding protein [Candidatus Acidoferrales bacterium]|nr:(2Fe-2S)-binding protein [Candidatus Acidoferrales bacterium]